MTSLPGSILVFLQNTPPSPIEKVIYNMDATTVRQWQIWLITGAIILLHCVSKTNAEILDEVLTRWEGMGYTFRTLDELPEGLTE